MVHVLNGVFTDAAVFGFLGVFKNDEFVYYGDNVPIETTTWEDTARFTAAAAIDSRPMPNRLNIRGDSFRPEELPARFAKSGRKVTVKRLGSIDELRALKDSTFQKDPSNFMLYLPLMYQLLIFSGYGLLEQPLHNSLFPDIKPETLEEAIARKAI